MSWGTFTDNNHKPTIEEANEAMANFRPVYQHLVRFVEDNFHVRGEFKFYGRNYGWAFRYNKSGKALVALYPDEGGFTVQVILDRLQTVDALNSGIAESVKEIVSNTPEIHEGRWIFIRVNSIKAVEDIEKLILIRAKKRGN